MLYYNEIQIEQKCKDKQFFIVADFDSTITNDVSPNSWEILVKLLSQEIYQKDRELWQKYNPTNAIEGETTEQAVRRLNTWYAEMIKIYIMHQVKEDNFEKLDVEIEKLLPREGFKEFIEYCYQKDIPFIIMSAGLGHSIDKFLKKYQCNYENVYVSANYMDFNNGILCGMKGDTVNALTKSMDNISAECRQKCKDRTPILLGDSISDLCMLKKEELPKAIKVGFATKPNYIEEYKKLFDVVATDNATYGEIRKLLKLE